MQSLLATQEISAAAIRIRAILGLGGPPIGVRLLMEESARPKDTRRLDHHRYCQALMRARRGESVRLDAEGIACPAAAAAFGFRPLPEGLRSGKGLVGFGIVADPAVGARMFSGMPRLETGRLQALHCFPLDRTAEPPDVVIVEDTVEKLMWIALASLHAAGGERVTSSTAVLQATCVDATLIPFLEHRMNLSYGCYGCRDATDIADGETILGFPGSMFAPILAHLEFLSEKAIPASRTKRALAALGADGQGTSQ